MELTLGQYYPVDSVIHRLDPRVKLAGTMIYLISLFVLPPFAGYGYAAVALTVVILMSGVPAKLIFKSLKPVFFVLIVTFLLNVFLTSGEELWSFWVLTVTREGLRQAIAMAIRLVLLVTGTSIMTLTTTPTSLTDGMEKSLGFLKIVRVPVHEIAMMISIALRFIPILAEEADKIKKAQMARGADFESGSIRKRVKAMIPLLIPLFVSAFRRADDLSMAMEARCYHGGEGRTRMKPLVYAKRDLIAYGVLAGYVAGCVIFKVFF